jgi:hypothetical protein
MATTDSRPARARGDEASRLGLDPWQPTPISARALGISIRTLKRYSSPDNGFLLPGVHWVAGPFSNSTIRWDVEACREVLHHRGMKAIRETDPAGRLPVVVGSRGQ